MTGGETIYLDYAAATPLDALVLEAMLPYLTSEFANPSASYGPARRARAAVDDARGRIAHLLGAKPAQIVFTAGATEANNLAFTAACPDAHVIVSAIEHESVRALLAQRAKSTLLPVSREGLVSARELEDALRPDTEFVSIAYANGEIGAVQPLRDLGSVVASERDRRLSAGERRPIYFHTDASQAAALRSLNVSSLGADLVTVSAAKLHGPKQVGLLWMRSGIELHPLVRGGGQEGGLRSGTENVAGIIGFARAFELAHDMRQAESARLRGLRDWLRGWLMERFPWAIVAGPVKDSLRLESLLHISFPGLEARRLVILLDRAGVCVGTGSACAASKMTVSHVLEAIGATPEQAAGSLRISLGRETTREDVERAAAVIIDVVNAEVERTGLLH